MNEAEKKVGLTRRNKRGLQEEPVKTKDAFAYFTVLKFVRHSSFIDHDTKVFYFVFQRFNSVKHEHATTCGSSKIRCSLT